jgi:hypothetical protein
MGYPKITSEAQCELYKEHRIRFANMGTLYVKLYAKEINELNLRIIEWNCRNDDHNPVQIFDKPKREKIITKNEGPKLHLRKSKS